jgi:hypothetical protein
MKKYLSVLAVLFSTQLWAGIPATPVMTLYKFNGDLQMPYYAIDDFARRGPASPAGRLTQGSSVIPCLVIRNGQPLTDSKGTPFVGFEVVVDSSKATPASTEAFKKVVAARQSMMVPNHHCGPGVRYVLDVRNLYPLNKAPFFDPPGAGRKKSGAGGEGQLDQIVRAFHNSSLCEGANRNLVGRRSALSRAWSRFISDNAGRWPRDALERAKHLDYVMRTAIFEGHLDRGCNAYGTCERNIVALSIRNRGRESCVSRQGCSSPGDFQGVSSATSQYNIWDEYLTQISGLTSCFLRDDLGSAGFTSTGRDSPKAEYYDKIRGIYEQNTADVQRILFGTDRDLAEIFPGTPLGQLKQLRHYYHAPAMGKCFPNNSRVEYISGAVAEKGNNYALIANQRIEVGGKADGGYFFKEFLVRDEPDRDVTSTVNDYPGFIIDGRKITLRRASSCPPYGVPRGCRFDRVGRYRKTPSWLDDGRPLAISCKVPDRGTKCQGKPSMRSVTVGDACDTQMRPVAGVR